MAIQWGSWVYSGNNGMRVGLDISWSGVDWTSSSTTATIGVYTQNQYTYADNQTVSYGGSIGGSLNYYNGQGANAVVQRDTKSFTHTYGANPATYNFSATLSGLYNGGSPSVSVNSTTPTRPAPPPPPVYPPSEPQSFTATAVSTSQINLSWSAPSSNGGATVTGYTLIRNGTTNLLSNANQTSYSDTGLTPNTSYSYTVAAVNSAGTGSSASASTSTLGGVGRIWNGSSYISVVPKVWNGSSWIDAQARIWDGTEWKYGI